MPPDWDHLQNKTVAAQLNFLEVEANAGITLARIALTARNRDKSARNDENARKAYETINTHLDQVPAHTPGLGGVREKMVILRQLLRSLEEKS